jgi:hypothetical protein
MDSDRAAHVRWQSQWTGGLKDDDTIEALSGSFERTERMRDDRWR